MFTRLGLLDDEVAVLETQVDEARVRVVRRRVGAVDALKRRLARPDSLLAAGGAGVLYGLWVTRPCGDSAPGGAGTIASSWLARAAASGALSWLLSSSAAPAAADPGVPEP